MQAGKIASATSIPPGHPARLFFFVVWEGTSNEFLNVGRRDLCLF